MENEILDKTGYAEGDEVNHGNTDSPIDVSYETDCEPKPIYFKKPHATRGGKDKIIQEIKKGREE